MTPRAIPLITLVTALCAACNGSSSQQAPSATAPATHEHSTGSEGRFPDPQTYAHELDDPDRDRWQKPEEVVELLECSPGMTVVDLGAGTGYFLGYLSEAVGPAGHVLGLDTERSMVDVMYERVSRDDLRNVRPGVVTADDPALTPRSVDRVLVVNTWHHLTDRAHYAGKLLTALRPGGLVLIVDFTSTSPKGPPAEMRLTSDTIVNELGSAGFAAEVLRESLPYQYVVAGRVP